MYPLQPNSSPPSKIERHGSAVAHGSALLIGLPLTFFLLPLPLSLVPCPVLAYLIARSFRRRRLAWGAFQGMQAAVMQLAIFLLMFIASLMDSSASLMLFFWTAGVLLFLFSLWGAVDAWLGYDFRYIGISSLLAHVSQANLSRQEHRRRWFGGWSGRDRQD